MLEQLFQKKRCHAKLNESFLLQGDGVDESRAASSRNAEKNFHQSIQNIENVTLQSGDLSHTTFYSQPKSAWTKHGQYGRKSCLSCCFKNSNRTTSIRPVNKIDNHHSPLRPEEYIGFRLRPMLVFYMKRLPGYSKSRTSTKVVTIIGSIGVISASFGFKEYC